MSRCSRLLTSIGLCPSQVKSCISPLQGTIRDNIAYGCEEATDEQVCEAANAASAMAFIKKAPAGMRTLVRLMCPTLPLRALSKPRMSSSDLTPWKSAQITSMWGTM